MRLVCSVLKMLAADETCVQTACDCDVGGAFDDRPAVGKERNLIRFFLELQSKVAVTDTAVRLKPLAYVSKIDRPIVLMDLNGISPAQCDVRPAGPGQMLETPLPAGDTVRARCLGGNL